MRKQLMFLLILLVSSCTNSNDQGSEIQRDIVSTNENKSVVEESKLAGVIKGDWRQISEDCNQKGEGCVPLSEETHWSFKKYDVVWGNYTRPYKITNDTIYIAGSPYTVISNQGDTLLFHAVQNDRYMQLIRTKL